MTTGLIIAFLAKNLFGERQGYKMKNSLLYWYPKIKNLAIPQPETEIVELDLSREEYFKLADGRFEPIDRCWEDIIKATKKVGYPLFMRTDETSNKHDWKNSCYVKKEDDLKTHISNLVEFSFLADIIGLPIRALVFRKFIPMKNLFTAFHGEMPVNPEIRFFVKDGKVLCKHWYWIKDAITNPSKDNWEAVIDKVIKETTLEDKSRLNDYAQRVANVFEGYWSVDFCKSKEDKWILIDMAEGHHSWHDKNCKITKGITKMRDQDMS